MDDCQLHQQDYCSPGGDQASIYHNGADRLGAGLDLRASPGKTCGYTRRGHVWRVEHYLHATLKIDDFKEA